MRKRKKDIGKIVAIILTPVSFILAWILSLFLGTLIIIWITGSGFFVMKVYYDNLTYFLTVYSFVIVFLIAFGVWFAMKFYSEK